MDHSILEDLSCGTNMVEYTRNNENSLSESADRSLEIEFMGSKKEILTQIDRDLLILVDFPQFTEKIAIRIKP